MKENIISFFILSLFILLMSIMILQALSGCGREDGSCIQIEDFITGVEK